MLIILIQEQLQNMQEIYSTATQLCKIADTIGIKPEQGAIILLSVESAVLIGELKRLHYLRLLEPDQQIENLPTSPAEAIKRGFTKAPNSQNRYHRNKGQLDNEKYIHSITGQEVIFDKQGQIVLEPANIGTKNYGTRPLHWKHFVYDMIPYWIWGNSEEDQTPLKNRIWGVGKD